MGDNVLGRGPLADLALLGWTGVGVVRSLDSALSDRALISTRLFLTVTAELRPELDGLSLLGVDAYSGLLVALSGLFGNCSGRAVAMLPVGSIFGKKGLRSGDRSDWLDPGLWVEVSKPCA